MALLNPLQQRILRRMCRTNHGRINLEFLAMGANTNVNRVEISLGEFQELGLIRNVVRKGDEINFEILRDAYDNI